MAFKLGLSEKHSLGLWGRNMERMRTTEEETGMSFCLWVDLFSLPGTNRAGRRELKVNLSLQTIWLVLSPARGGGSLADLEPQETSGEVQPKAGGLILVRAMENQN